MNLKYSSTLIPIQTTLQLGGERVQAVSWAPNNQRLATCRSDRVIQLFDEKGVAKDKFMTRARDLKAGNQSYVVTAISFSPDSISLAVGQSDSMVFVYKIGEDFKMKKSITNKFQQPAPVTSLIWPSDVEIICGLTDGKIRNTNMMDRKGPKSKTAFSAESCVVCIVANNSGTEMASSFADGQIAVFTIGNPDQMTLKCIIRHTVPATGLAIGLDCVFAGGSDMKIFIYEKGSGKVKQLFDYSKDSTNVFDISSAALTATGQTIVFGSSNKLRIYHFASRKKIWEEGRVKKIKNLYVPTALQWRKDGGFLIAATSIGTFHLFEAAYKRSKNDKVELSYITPSNVMMKVVETGKTVNIKSKYGSEIVDIQLMGKDCYAVSRTSETLILCDIERNLSSEIPWSDVEEKERFYFENPTVCMIFNDGEMSLIEYGSDDVLGTFRTELINPHVISVRVNERLSKKDADKGGNNKKLAYLLDLKSIAIVDLEYGLTLGHINHDSKVDWIELNETGTKLLYRDRRTRLIMVDIDSMNKYTLDQTCGFVQWVPGSDVIVAQSKKLIRIWYNLDTPEMSVDIDVKGIATDIVKEGGKTVIIVKEGNVTHEIPLDQSRIEFTTAIEDGDLARAASFLDTCDLSPEVYGMWAKLAKVSAEAQELRIAHKAYAAVGDVPRAKFLQTTLEICKSEPGVNPMEKGFWKSSYEVQARMCLMAGQIKMAEAIYLNHGDVERAIKMYEVLQKWDEAITLAKIKHHPRQQQLVDEFLERLINSGQYDVAAEFLEKHGRSEQSINLYLEGGFPTKAARVVMKSRNIQQDRDLVSQVCESLLQGEFLEEAGELFETIGQKSRALECYRRGTFYDKAIKLAKQSYPNEVVPLEEEWGDYLLSCRQLDAATNHYIEAGCLIKGLDAAIESRQWKKAIQILEAIEDVETVSKQWIKLGEYYNSIDDLSQAENCFLKGGNPKRAVEMYTEKDRWEDAHRIATQTVGLSKVDLQNQYIEQAKTLQEQGRYLQAEKLLVAIGEIDVAISMYAKNKMYDEVLRLVSTHHSEHLGQTLKHLAEINLQEENFKAAETHYVKAGLWSEAVDMYQGRGLWEDAYRVARNHGGVAASKNVIFKWAAALAPDTAVKLLIKFGYVYDCIDYHCMKGNFPVAQEIAQLGARDKMMDIELLWAQNSEEKGDYEDAKQHYLNANMNKEAVNMYLRAHNLPKAIETAENFAPDELRRVLLMHAENLFEDKDYTNFEAIIMRAEKPEIAVEFYKRNNMWAEAFRVCKQYAPHLSNQLQDDYASFDARNDTKRQPEEIIEQAKEFERQGEYRKAIERYLQLTPQIMDNDIVLARCWTRAAELASKFLLKEHSDYVMKSLAPMLSNINRHAEAASLYVQCQQYKEAIRALIDGGLWDEARRLAAEVGPKMEDYVKMKHTENLKASGQVEQLEGVNVHAALELLCEQGQWIKCLERAKNNDDALNKYLSKYVTHLVRTKRPKEALKVYIEYGTPCNKTHFTLYKALATLLFMDVEIDDYEVWAELRNIMFSVMNGLNSSGADHRSKVYMQMDNLLWVSHFFVNKTVFKSTPSLEPLAAKICVSLLRFSGLIPVERAFFEAGIMCRKVQWYNMAFVFLNHYLDIRDAIDEGTRSTIGLDHSDFLDTDIPTECDLSDASLIPDSMHNEAKEWVLSASMDGNIQQVLRQDERNVFEGSLISGDEKCDPCVLTGYPVTGSKVSFRTTNRSANKEDWNRFIAVSRSEPNEQLTNIGEFISSWCGINPNYSF